MMNSVNWLSRETLFPAVSQILDKVDTLLDIGCGIKPQNLVVPKVHICCEPYSEYVENLQQNVNALTDRSFLILQATWAEAVRVFPPKSVDTIYLADVIEHLDKEEGAQLLRETEKIARRQIAIFTPYGFMPQCHPDGVDAWGMNGGDWQEHKSGWLPEDFGPGWDFYACKDFHPNDHSGRPFEKPYGAFWAVRNMGTESDRLNAEGEALFQSGNKGNACDAFINAIREDSDNPNPYINMGVLAWEYGSAEMGLRFIKAALDIEPSNQDAALNSVLMLQALGQGEAALEMTRFYSQQFSDNAQFRQLLQEMEQG